jgi:hypothetical protein
VPGSVALAATGAVLIQRSIPQPPPNLEFLEE